ncbi:hypothetical protein BHE74_00007270 [Ensete ventricosum]|nr:hypothetical protein BHE74_00007270 [Ensete ventricosum]
MEVGQPPGRLADGGIGVGVDEVACVLKRVAEAEYGRKAAAVCVVDVQKKQDDFDEVKTVAGGHCCASKKLLRRLMKVFFAFELPVFPQNMTC